MKKINIKKEDIKNGCTPQEIPIHTPTNSQISHEENGFMEFFF